MEKGLGSGFQVQGSGLPIGVLSIVSASIQGSWSGVFRSVSRVTSNCGDCRLGLEGLLFGLGGS